MIFFNVSLEAQLGISHVKHEHSTLLSLDYEPFSDYYPFIIRYGKVPNSKTYIGANIGYSPGPSDTPNSNWREHLYTAGLESEYLLTRHIAQYQLGISVFGRYQFEHFDDTENESKHHFDIRIVGHYPFRYKKFSISPYGSYGVSDFSGSKFRKTRSFGGMIGFHFSESDYCYLKIYSQRYDNGNGYHRTFVSLGLLW